MTELLSSPEVWLAFATLAALEIVLGIDNIVFISILAGKLPVEDRARARKIGLSLAMFIRIALLWSITWVMRLTTPWFVAFGNEISGRDMILLVGGLFLIAKSTHEIHEKLEGEEGHGSAKAAASFVGIIIQILLLDIVFSLDSVITAVGMAQAVIIMIVAMVIAVVVMLIFADKISDFIGRYPSMKVLALSFLLLIGVLLMADGFGQHINKG